MSMVLIEDMSAKSHVSQRMWATVKGLKAYAPTLLLADGDADVRPRESAALTMAGMARMSRGAQPPYETLSLPGRHGSFSSASVGYQATPSPRMTPGLGVPSHAPSRVGSLTPHADRFSPHTAGVGGALGSGPPPPGGEDIKNGLRLRTEMSRMFDALSNGVGLGADPQGADDSFSGSDNEYPAARGQFMHNADSGVYPLMKKMF